MGLKPQHQEKLKLAIEANASRTYFSAYPENPKAYAENAMADGLAAFQAAMNRDFMGLLQENPIRFEGEEVSPYLQLGLGIRYPVFADKSVVMKSRQVAASWSTASVDQRTAVLMDSLDGMANRFFEIAYATMHTTGQAFMMSFQASGPHAADRAMETIAMGYQELNRFPQAVVWDKPMGKFNLTVNKTWKAVSKGTGLVIGCSTFPTWNTVPGVYANLIVGNPVIVKPHPKAVLPIAIVVEEIQKALVNHGFDPHICQLSVDTTAFPLTKEYANHPDVKLIDYTGNSVFGNWLETLTLFGKSVFTEKAGVNSVIIDSTDNFKGMLDNLAFSLCLYSGQMCTAPQNFFIPSSGIETNEGHKSYDEVVEGLVQAVAGLVDNPKAGPFVLGAIQNEATLKRLMEAPQLPGTTVALASKSVLNPEFADARTASPLLLKTDSSQKALFSSELFGPIALLIATKDTNESVKLASALAAEHGAISCGAYTSSLAVCNQITEAMALSFTPVSFNLTAGLYVNQNAAFSDFHVTGGNPAGNASFTDPNYLNRRFVWVGQRNSLS